MTGRSAGWGKGLAQSLSDFGRGGIVINHEASGVSMPNHAREIQHVQLSRQPGQGFMAGIVECQVIDARYLDRLAEKYPPLCWRTENTLPVAFGSSACNNVIALLDSGTCRRVLFFVSCSVRYLPLKSISGHCSPQISPWRMAVSRAIKNA